jgi:hypothetical protein
VHLRTRYTGQGRKAQFNQYQPALSLGRIIAHLGGCGVGLRKIARGPPDLCTTRDERSCGLNAESCGAPVTSTRLPVRSTPSDRRGGRS